MSDSYTDLQPTALSAHFAKDAWFKFTDDTLNPSRVKTILDNAYSPAISAHSTTIEGVRKAGEEVLAQNGEDLLKALETLGVPGPK